MVDKNVENIEYGCDNLEILKVVKYLLGVVINDIEYMNEDLSKNDYLDLGNNTIISVEDFESIVSMVDTLYYVGKYNKN